MRQMKKKIAVIGSGMAGLTSAWLCRKAGAEVTILEARKNRGMDSYTQFLNVKGHQLEYVDVPLRVMSPHAWPTVLDMCKKLGVDTYEVDTQVTCSWLNSKTWFRSSKIKLGSKVFPFTPMQYILRKETYRILLGFIQLTKSKNKLLSPDLTLKEFADQNQIDPLFWKGLIYPLLKNICTSDEKTLDQWPAKQILDILQKIVFGDRLRRLHGGTKSLAEKLGKDLNWHCGLSVKKLVENQKEIIIHSNNGELGPFDIVICAVQANQLNFLPNKYENERKILNKFPYDSGTLWVHQDIRFMPEKKKDWSPIHYQINKDLSRSMFSVWVNPIEPTITHHDPILQTWEPIFEPKSEKVIIKVPMERAVVNHNNQNLIKELDNLHKSPSRKVFFCGSYAAPGVPLLESATISAINAVSYLGFDSTKMNS